MFGFLDLVLTTLKCFIFIELSEEKKKTGNLPEYSFLPWMFFKIISYSELSPSEVSESSNVSSLHLHSLLKTV